MAKDRHTRPLHPDRIASIPNRPPGELPREVQALARRRVLYVSSLTEEVVRYKAIEAEETERGVRLELGESAVEGLLGERLDLVKPGKDDADAEDANPDAPDWAGRVYHPQSSIPDRFSLMRRKSGRRVRPNVVVGADNRQVYYPLGYPWHCIGRLYVWNNAAATNWAWTGSGALVGTNVVLTAAHVVPWGAASWKMKFVPAHYDGTSIYGTGMETWVSRARGYVNTNNVVGWDIATLRLTQDLGTSLGYFGTKHYSSSWNDDPYWTHCGYASAVSGTRPNWQGGISVEDTDSDSPGLEVEHNGDVTGGDSGGPLFAWWDPGPYIVGTHSGQEQEWHFPFSFPWVNVDAGGGALNSLVRWARDNW